MGIVPGSRQDYFNHLLFRELTFLLKPAQCHLELLDVALHLACRGAWFQQQNTLRHKVFCFRRCWHVWRCTEVQARFAVWRWTEVQARFAQKFQLCQSSSVEVKAVQWRSKPPLTPFSAAGAGF